VLRAVERVVFFVEDVDEAVAWYRQVLDGEVDRTGLPTVVAGEVELGFHPADAKTPAGVGGAVAYCRVDSLDMALDRFTSAGATLYRGPLTIEDGRRICQVRDPFGNVLGTTGP
jgi:predicted enzyme related to lactoylglutathione lyase